MIALSLFLMALSMVMAFLSFFPNWAPDSPEFLKKTYLVLANMWLAVGVFLSGMGLLFLFG